MIEGWSVMEHHNIISSVMADHSNGKNFSSEKPIETVKSLTNLSADT